MKKLLFLLLSVLATVALCFGGVGCNRSGTSSDSIQQPSQKLENAFGAVLEGAELENFTFFTEAIGVDNEARQEVLDILEESGVELADKALAVLDLALMSGEAKVQPNGKVKVTVPAFLEDSITEYKVYHLLDNDTIEELEAEYKDGKITFETSSFSYFVIATATTFNATQYYETHSFENVNVWVTVGDNLTVEDAYEKEVEESSSFEEGSSEDENSSEDESSSFEESSSEDENSSEDESSSMEGSSSDEESLHEHAFSTEYEMDDIEHWFVCECGEMSERMAHDFELITDPSTCTVPGMMRSTCKQCGYTNNANDLPLADHTFGEWTKTQAATCTESGEEQRSCLECGKTESKEIPARGHKFGEWTETKVATCTEEGERQRVCSICGKTETRVIGMLKHDIANIPGTAATCTEDGMEGSEYCKNCDYKADGEVIPALGHDLKVTKEIAPTCTETGKEAYEKCTRCDYEVGGDEIPALGHNIEVNAGKAPTCVEDGVEAGEYCTRCDYKVGGDVIPATGHDIVTILGVAATCTEDGVADSEYCKNCNYKVEGKVIPALGHDIEETKEIAPTCTETGKEASEYCTRCDYEKVGEIIPALGHSFDGGVVTKAPTHLEEGIKTYTCTVCGETKEESIEKTPGHSFGDWTPDEANETRHYKECACGEIETADCTFDENGTCTACGREKSEEVDGIIIVISGGTATFESKETVTSDSKLYGENAKVYIAQENDVLNVTLKDQTGRTFKHWVSASGTIIPDEDFSMLVLRSGYYYPVFEDTDTNAFSNRVKVYEGNCEEGILYMSTNSKGDVKYEIEYVNYGHHAFDEMVDYNDQYHKQECLICGETIFELHTEYSIEVEKEAGHTEEGLMRYECFCGHVWTEAIPVTDEHTIDYDDWHIVEESKNGQYGKYRVYCKYCDYYEEYWYLGGLDFISFIDGKMINYQYTYGGKVSHNEYYYSYRNAEGKKVYIWAFQYEYEYSSNADYNDTYIFMYIDDEDSTTIEPIYLSKSRGDRRAEYLWAIYGYAYDVNGWIETLDYPDDNMGCGNGMVLGNSMSARASVFEAYHDYWAETYNKLRIPTSKAYDDLSDTPWEIEFEGKSFQGGYYDENDEYVMTGGRDVISFVKDAGTSYKKYMHVDKATGITYGYEDFGTYYRTTFIMRTYKTIVSPEEFEKLDAAGQSVHYSYGDIEKDIKSLCAKRNAFNNFTLTIPETINAFRLLFSDPVDCVEISGDDTNVYYNTAHVYDSGSPITFTWNGEEGIVFDRYEIWDFVKQEWVVLSEEANYTFNTLDNPRRIASYVRVICHEVDVPVDPSETYRISVENGYFEIDGEIHYGAVEVPANTLVYVYANEVAGKTFEHWLDGNGEELTGHSFNVISDMTLTPVYTDAIYRVYCEGWSYESYISIDGGEMHYTDEFEGKIGDTFELSTSSIPDGECTVFIGWYMETYGQNGTEYILISDSQSFTYEITGEENGFLYAVWTTGENPFIKKYVDIRAVNGFVSYAGGEASEHFDNAYSAISLSSMGRVRFFDDPTDEIDYRVWDIAYRYELEGEVMHDVSESFEDEYDYYPAEYWVSDPQYSYPDGVINVTGIEDSLGDLEEGVEVELPA